MGQYEKCWSGRRKMTFDEQLKAIQFPQGLKELLNISLSEETKKQVAGMPSERAKEVIHFAMREAKNGSVEPLDELIRGKL